LGTLFYSWQSDTPSGVNRNFIKSAIEKALKNVNINLNVEEALRLDQDTKGVPGTPDVANTILNKIDECEIFIPDLSIVAKTNDKKQVPNPNVLLELGYAMKSIGSEHIITVLNEAYGTVADGLPFDLQHRRWPIRYSLSPESTAEIREEQKKFLISYLEEAIKTILDNKQIEQNSVIFQPVQSKWKSSSFFDNNEKVARHTSLGPDIIWINGPQAFLRLIPTSPIIEKTPLELEKLIQLHSLMPMGTGPGGYWIERNKYGALTCSTQEQQANMLTQVFRNGEIWGLNAYAFREDRKYIASGYTEKIFEKVIQNYLSFANSALELSLPLRFIAGLSGVEDFQITINSHDIAGNCVDDEVILEGKIDSYSVSTHELLVPFFKRIWEACGFDYKGT
jgi:hypothetical protein